MPKIVLVFVKNQSVIVRLKVWCTRRSIGRPNSGRLKPTHQRKTAYSVWSHDQKEFLEEGSQREAISRGKIDEPQCPE